MKLLIIENEKPVLKLLIQLLCEMGSDYEIVDIIEDHERIPNWFAANPMPDLVISSFKFSDEWNLTIFREVNKAIPILFTISFDQYIIKAFDSVGIDYLLKPIQKEYLEKALIKYKTVTKFTSTDIINNALVLIGQRKFRKSFKVCAGDESKTLSVENIAYFHSEHGLSFIKTKDGKRFVLNDSLDKIEHDVDPKSFFRANLHYLVSVSSVKKVSTYFNDKLKIFLRPTPEDEEIVISKYKVAEFKKWMDA